ncbi:MAG: hypothetical protein KME49_25655 [Brasilonema octagenarum HA4186-MV1]|jgi:hypothetical protein|nr:hypothetical protein [Brasilonema octagenarum HA4186-MV1]
MVRPTRSPSLQNQPLGWQQPLITAATNHGETMPNIYQDYCEIESFFGEQAFYKLDVKTLSTLSADALFRLQNLIIMALAEKLKEKN